MNKSDKILVTGHRGLVGSAVVRNLQSWGFDNVITLERTGQWGVDLLDPVAVRWAFSCHEPDYVFHCAAKVGGIVANQEDPVGFFQDNINIQNNVLREAARYNVRKLLFLGSSCIYPRDSEQPIKESALLTGSLERTNEAYALAKICGVKLCEWLRGKGHDFISAMPCNVFGPNDNFNAHTAHVVPGLLARMDKAKRDGDQTFHVWGQPDTTRELIHADNLARALLFVMEKYSHPLPINVGSGVECSMMEIASLIANVVQYRGQLVFRHDMPAGTPRKCLDNSRLAELGFQLPVKDSLYDELCSTYEAMPNASRR